MPDQDVDVAGFGGLTKFYRQIVESSPDLICTYEAGGVLTFVNEAFCRFFGQTRAQLLGKSILQIVAPADLPTVTRRIARLDPDMAPATLEFDLLNSAGDCRQIQWTSTAVQDGHGAFQVYQSIGRDITERHAAQATIAKLVEALAPRTGEEFFRTLVDYLSRVCQVEFAFIGEIDPRDPSLINTLAVAQKGQATSGFSYSLKGTPCADLLVGEFCHIEGNVQTLYPEDQMLIDLGITSYMGVPLHDSANCAVGLLVMAHTGAIADPKQASALLRVTAARAAAELDRQRVHRQQLLFRSLIDRSTDCFEIIDAETGRYLDINERACRDRGFSREEFLQLSVFDMNPQISRERWRQRIDQLRREGSIYSNNTHSKKDGTTFPVEILSTYANLDREYCVAVVRDATEKEAAEAAMRESQQRLRLAVETGNIGYWQWNIAESEVVYSREWKSQLGYQEHEVGDDLEEFTSRLHPEDAPRVEELQRKILQGVEEEFESEYRVRHKDGSFRWFHSHGVAQLDDANAPSRVVGVHLDITERKRASDALLKSQQQLAAIAATLPQALYVFDIQKQENVYSNRGVWQSLGYTHDEIRAGSDSFLKELIHPDDIEQISQLRSRWDHAKDSDVLQAEYRLRAADGSWRWFEARDTVFMRDNNGDVQQIIGTATDISVRKDAEEEIANSERRLSAIASTMPQALYVFDLVQRSVTFTNRPFGEALGMTPSEIVQQGDLLLQQVLHPEDIERLPQLAERWEHAHDDDVFEGELRVRSRDGQWRWFSTRETVFQRGRNGQVSQIIGTAKDITEEKIAEELKRKMSAHLLRAQKLESLSVLAGGVAHDFNNLITVILSFAGLAKSRTDSDSPLQPMLLEIEHACMRASDLTKQMLAYAGRGQLVVESVRLDELAYEMSRLLRQIIPESVAIESKILPAMIDGDATQMRQVIMNLIKNAADAVQNAPSSQILLETGVCRFDPSSVRGHLLPDRLPAGDYAFVRVTDNGCGISSETIDKIFDPFFSTKSNGQGLGLAAALGIVRGHDGAILVESQVNHGTTFQVLIPANQKLALRRPSTRRSSLAQGARVLTIDDEPKICELVSEILGNANLQVQTVSQPHRALSMIANAEPPYELIVMDLRMEEMPGEETLRRIRAICQTPVVIISGCGEKEIEARLQGQVVEGILNKPFSAQELVQVVRGVLANQPTVT